MNNDSCQELGDPLCKLRCLYTLSCLSIQAIPPLKQSLAILLQDSCTLRGGSGFTILEVLYLGAPLALSLFGAATATDTEPFTKGPLPKHMVTAPELSRPLLVTRFCVAERNIYDGLWTL